MDGITFEQFQAAVSDSLGIHKDDTFQAFEKGLERLLSTQKQSLDKLQSFIGQKIDALTERHNDTNQKFSELKSFFKKSDSKNATAPSKSETTQIKKEDKSNNGLQEIKLVSSSLANIPSSLKVLPVRVVDATNKAKEHTGITLSPETKKFFEGTLSDVAAAINNKSQTSKERSAREYDEKRIEKISGKTNTETDKQIKKDVKPVEENNKSLISNLLAPVTRLFNKNDDTKEQLKTTSKKAEATNTSPYHHEEINVLFPSETRVFLENLFGDNVKRLIEGNEATNDNLEKILSNSLNKKEEKKDEPWWKKLMPLLLGAGALIGGLVSFIGGLFESGPLKGLEKIFAKGGFSIALKMLSKFFGKNVLKHIPIIGTILSLSFAWSRFTSGDTVGGIIDTLSAMVNLIDFVVPGLGTVLSIGLDAFNAFLDFKAGEGTGKERSAKKLSIIKDIGNWIYDKVKDMPVIGSLIKMGSAIGEGKWDKVLGYLGNVYTKSGLKSVVNWLVDNRETITEGAMSTATAIGNFTLGVGKWLYEKAKLVPIIGPLIKAGESLFNGNWDAALSNLGDAIEPLGQGLSWLYEKASPVVASAAVAAGDIISNVASWLYDKAKMIPIIGPIIKAGEAIADGKWGDVLGFLGEAITPLQYIGGLIANGAKAATVDVTSGITSFFDNMKDSLFRAVLDMVPDIKVGPWSLKSQVAKLLGISVTQSTATPPPQTLPSNTPVQVPVAPQQQNSTANASAQPSPAVLPAASQPPTNFTHAIEDDDEASTTRPLWVARVTPNTQNDYSTKQQDDDTGEQDSDNLDGMHTALKQHTNFLKSMLEYQKQTAKYTKQLIDVIQNLESNSTVNVSTVNSPTNFNTTPMTSTMFRQSVLA